MTMAAYTSRALSSDSDALQHGHGTSGPVAVPRIAVRRHHSLEPRYEPLQSLGVVCVPIDRAAVEPLSDLGVTWRGRIAAILVKAQTGVLERQAEIVEESSGLRALILDER